MSIRFKWNKKRPPIYEKLHVAVYLNILVIFTGEWNKTAKLTVKTGNEHSLKCVKLIYVSRGKKMCK